MKKKTLALLADVALGLFLGTILGRFLVCCERETVEPVDYGTEFGSQIVHFPSLSVYKADNQYLITVYNEPERRNRIERKVCVFTEDRACAVNYGVSLIENYPLEKFIGVDISTVQTVLGKSHADVGSGISIPAYITEDAYLICFEFEKEKVFMVFRVDLLTDEFVEKVVSP